MAATYKYLSGTGSTQIKVGATKLKGFIVASGTSPTVKIYNTKDGTTTGTDVTGTLTFSGSQTPSFYALTGDDGGVNLDQGLYVTLGGTSPVVTFIYE